MASAPVPRPSLPDDSADRSERIFISCSELQKEALGRPFKALLNENGLRGFIVSDDPRLEGTWTPEEKVDAYLELSGAVIVFATGDLAAGDERYTRPNIGDEIARARSKPHLRDRVCVLKQPGVILPSNINPAYESLDPAHPAEGFRRALMQLRQWGVRIDRLPDPPIAPATPTYMPPAERPAVDVSFGASDQKELLDRAQALIPGQEHAGDVSLAMVLAGAPRQSILRPAELEAPALTRQLTQLLLFGEPAILQPDDGTKSGISGSSLVIRQTNSWMTLDEEGSIVVVRPLHRGEPRMGLSAVIEENVRADIEAVLRFAGQVLERLDPEERLRYVTPLVALAGASYGAWRTRAEHAASPNSMTVNMLGSKRPVASLSPPARSRQTFYQEVGKIAEDLTILLRRVATG